APASRQWSKRSHIATAELAPQPLDAANTRRLAAEGGDWHSEVCGTGRKRWGGAGTDNGIFSGMPRTQTTAAQRPASARPTSPELGFHKSKYRASVWRAGKGFFTPLEPRRCIFCQPAALQKHPDIEARVGFDDQVVGHAGVVMVVAQTETANHECET